MTRFLRPIVQYFSIARPVSIFTVASLISVVDAFILYAAAIHDRVIFIENGVGLFQNYGLISNLAGNIVFPLLSKLYYDESQRIFESGNAVPTAAKAAFDKANRMLLLQGKYTRAAVIFFIVGGMTWLSNVSFHLFSDPQVHWGNRVFDSTNHLASFFANRINNFYTWCMLLPVCAHIIFSSTYLLIMAFKKAFEANYYSYDLLHPDRFGGFLFLEKARLLFNIVLAVAYVEIAAHSGTFKANPEHVLSFVAASFILIFGNRVFMGDVFHCVRKLKSHSINILKDKIYANDTLSFEIYKYFYEIQGKKFTVANVFTKLFAIGLSAAIKSLPVLLGKVLV